jgi:hypothetical protein
MLYCIIYCTVYYTGVFIILCIVLKKVNLQFKPQHFISIVYTTWPKVCGHLLVEHLIPKSWVFIWSWSPLCCWESFPLDIGAPLLGLPFSHKSISEVGHWCWAIRPSSQSAFQFIPKVFDAVEVRALCRGVKFFYTDFKQTISVWTSLCGWGHCHNETGKVLQHTFATRLETQNRLECHCML